MIKNYIKSFLKKNRLWFNLFSKAIYFYLRFVYFSSRWQFIWQGNYDQKSFGSLESTIFAMWHNRLAFGPGIFKLNTGTAALVSPHSDGKLISSIINKFEYEVIEGSSNRNSNRAIKEIIGKLSLKYNIVITPDGPRGPKYKVKGNITNIARKYGQNLIPVSCSCSRFILLKSWDQLIMPLPFNKITVIIGKPMLTSNDINVDNENLEKALNDLTIIAEETARKT